MATSERLTVECVRECAEWVPGPSHSVPAPDWRDARALAREVLERREDERVAATDYQILIPEPGTPMAVLLSANVLMRRERATLTATEARLAAIEVSARKVCPLDNNEGYEDEDGDTAFYRCFNEDGDAFIEAEDLPEAVEQIVGSYDKACLALESKDERIHALTRQLAEALQQRDAAVAIAREAVEALSLKRRWADHECQSFRARLAQIGGKE